MSLIGITSLLLKCFLLLALLLRVVALCFNDLQRLHLAFHCCGECLQFNNATASHGSNTKSNVISNQQWTTQTVIQ